MASTTELSALWFSPWTLGLLGLCIGSFINVVVHRLPIMLERQWRQDSAAILGTEAPAETPETAALSLASPRSRCPHCGHRIRWFENLPVLSWLLLRGRCSACHAGIALRYPLVELGCAALFAWIGQHFGAQPAALAWCGFAAMLLTLALIDWDTTLLPDSLTQPLLWAGLIAAALGWTQPLADALWGAVAGYLSLYLITATFKLATGKDGMGEGDFKLLAALGAWLGAGMLLPVVLAASLCGAVVGIGMKLQGSLREGRYVPFGPFLAGGGAMVLLAGEQQVLRWMGWA
ncbi:type 4 prepilin peptidase 1 [Sphaerotilus hippei]|uniref:Prepilin leader peptidase/N-methyltransferase n=1 Tax=Sphaerotilus hippei TaxID=744406 RepID=A0A318H2F5_9BURK|nr:A24 family peptidase [Sphaerotilus hippei]PXW96969.1 type 4 prepilin peptidase 1 [Sphaerotilus hippei]